MEKANLPEQYHLEWTALSYQERQNEGQIIYLMALALMFAYLFLVAQYESWTIPVPVMLTVSFAVCGALIGIMFTPALYAFFQHVRETGKKILHLNRPRD